MHSTRRRPPVPGTDPGVHRRIRRLRFTASGALFTLGAFATGLAAINTGNNLLYLLLGGMLGLVGVSGFLSQRMLRVAAVRRLPVPPSTAGEIAVVRYEVRNRSRWLPTLALEVGERGGEERGFLPALAPARRAIVEVHLQPRARGVHPLAGVAVETAAPFGFFHKGREHRAPGVLVVRPRHDLPVEAPASGGSDSLGIASRGNPRRGLRGEYRALREYLPGDDPRDVHWPSTARTGAPVVREYEPERRDQVWICVDGRAAPGEAFETAVEVAASLAVALAGRGWKVGLAAPNCRIQPGIGERHAFSVLDALAAVRGGSGLVLPPEDLSRCVLVTASAGLSPGPWGDVFGPERWRARAPEGGRAGDDPWT